MITIPTYEICTKVNQIGCLNPFLIPLFIKKWISIFYNNTGARVNSFVARQLDQIINNFYYLPRTMPCNKGTYMFVLG